KNNNYNIMQKTTYKLSAFLIISSLFLLSCGNAEEETNHEEIIIEDNTEEVIKTDDATIYMLPSPLQIAELFKRSGLTYIGDLTNPKENAAKINTKYDQKLNFGVYSADMAYCIMNNQTQESINYLKVLKDLSEKLWMTDILHSMGLSERLEANIGNEDSLTYIMADMQMEMDGYLDENGLGSAGSVIFAGAWIETMYIGVQVNSAKKNDKLISRLSEQSIVLDGLIGSIKQANEGDELAGLIADLEKINAHFDAFDEESDEAFILSDEALTNLANDIVQVRTKIVEL
ncbi:MAG: hypothetical protein J5I47_11205, partial [Vicingus serpentipes]|nr:hypothetical protein [Vicingus serpentipes]